MKRNPRKVKWTKAYRKLAGKELVNDTTFQLERQRNRPVKYNRELVKKTLIAVKKVDDIRHRRYQRMKLLKQLQNRKIQAKQDKAMLRRDLPLVRVEVGQPQDTKMDIDQSEKVKQKIKIPVQLKTMKKRG